MKKLTELKGLSEYLSSGVSWQDKILCLKANLAMAKSNAIATHFVGFYFYSIVLQGELSFELYGRTFLAKKDDLFIFSPSIRPVNVKGSADYQSICLAVSDRFSHESFIVRRMFKTTLFPWLHMQMPIIHLSEEEVELLSGTHMNIQKRISTQSGDIADNLLALYALFLCDITNIQKSNKPFVRNIPTQFPDTFINFMVALQEDACVHHDISYFSNKLNISSRYLSKIVKLVTNKTVMYFINQELFREACWQLKFTEMSIQQISEKLHFADAYTFSKFFKRMNGSSPKEYRNIIVNH